MNQKSSYSPEIQASVLHIMETILALPGKKILVLLLENSPSPEMLDLSEEEEIELKDHPFCQKLGQAILSHGSLFVRQFLHLKVEIEPPDGKPYWSPIKRLYGIVLGASQWVPISIADMKMAYTIDMETGRPLPSEPDIVFGEIPVAY